MLGKWEDLEILEETINQFADAHPNSDDILASSQEALKTCQKLKPKHELIPISYKSEGDDLYCNTLEIFDSES